MELCIAFRINHLHIRARDHLPMKHTSAHTHTHSPYGYPIRIYGGLLCKSVRDSNVFVLFSNEQIEIKEEEEEKKREDGTKIYFEKKKRRNGKKIIIHQVRFVVGELATIAAARVSKLLVSTSSHFFCVALLLFVIAIVVIVALVGYSYISFTSVKPINTNCREYGYVYVCVCVQCTVYYIPLHF